MTTVPALSLAFRQPDYEAKALPNNIEAEQAVLGAVMFDNLALERCEGLEGHHFYEPFHERLWSAMAARIARGALAEPIVLQDELASDPAYEEMGGLAYLGDLIEKAPPPYKAGDYAQSVIDHFMRREVIRVARDAEARARDPEEPAKALIEATESELFSLAENTEREGGFADFGSAIDGAMEMAQAAFARDGTVAGVSTGLVDLDQKLGGLHPSDLIILAGRPSMGKTALATNIAFTAAKAGEPVGFFSLEMSKEQLAMRLLADVSGISSDRIRKGEIDATEYRRLHEAGQEIRSAPLHIDHTGGISLAKLAGRARRLKRRQGLSLIVIDYLQLVTAGDGSRRRDRVQEVSEITQGLKALAKDLGVPVLALSQLSRQVENRDDKRPQLSDLRESGSIEQDADVVAFVYREAYYLGRAEPKPGTAEHLAWLEAMDQSRHLAEVIIGKQRHGPIGTVKLHFNEDLTRFGNLARERDSAGLDFSNLRVPYGRED